MKVINLYSGPGGGKSTTAAGLFNKMKLMNLEVELVTEFAKDVVWSEHNFIFTEQDYIFSQQNHRLRRLIGKVDWVITDSPINLSHFYISDDFPGKKPFLEFVDQMFDSYQNVNILLERCKAYNPNGRNQTEEEAVLIDNKIAKFLSNYPHHIVPGNESAPDVIINNILPSC